MADNNQNQQNPFNHGDILGSISGDVTQIKGHTEGIRSNTDLLKSIDRNLTTILQNSGNWSQQSARSRIYDTVDSDRGYTDNDPYHRRAGNNRNQQSRSLNGSADGFVESFFEELQKEILGAGFKSAVQQSMKDFASALGVQVQDIPKLFGQTLAKEFKNSDVGKRINERINQSMDSIFRSSMDRMRSGINNYYNRATQSGRMQNNQAFNEQQRWTGVLGRIERNFANRRTDANNDPTPGGSDDSGNNSNPSPDTSSQQITSVLSDKLQYLYPIYTTLNLVNDGVHIIADYATKDDDSMSAIMDVFHQTSDQVSQQNNDFIENLLNQGLGGGGGGVGDLIADIGSEIGPILSDFASGGLSAGAAMSGLAAAAGPAILAFVAVNAALWLVDKAIERFQKCFEPLKESFEDLQESIGKASNRFFESERKKISDQTDRLREDVRTMVETPFQIMEDAAKEWYAAWDNNLKTINATQGYTKADLQNLMANYSERLRSEGLSNVVSAADISNNLAKVLESGLTGKAAEEFAYLATKLNNAVPTQDFFSYADTYASIAANQIALGKSQSEALESANKQLTLFASNILYSSRELAGGFASGLNNASNLLENAVKIANTAGVGDSSMISGVLTAISSVIGSVAPDLASSITDVIVDAALGGNTDALVALRSQAGTGAANTSFLNAFARNPQKVIQTLFGNLSNLQNMSKDNFMEVAESLAGTFGMSIGAFTRIDFESVANAVSNMNVNLNSINSNMKLLQEGQTTTTAEQLKMQQVNEMILDQGLSYVLDNEAARSIQEHMWQQEIAAELMETEYSVDLTGKALEFLSGIKETINNILNFLNPFSWLKKVISVGETFTESLAIQSDIKRMLEAGKVGSGNANSLYNLTTYDVDKLTNKPGNLAEMMTGKSNYRTVSSIGSMFRWLTSSGLESNISGWGLVDQLLGGAYRGSSGAGGVSSQYDWNYITKGMTNGLGSSGHGAYVPGQSNSMTTQVNTASSQSQVTNKNVANLTDYLNSMESYVADNKSYEDWLKSASDYGIADVEAAVSPYDIKMSELEGKFQEYEAAKGSEYDYNQDALQQDFWNRVEKFLEEDFPEMFDEIITRLDTQIELMTNIDLTLTAFFDSWKNDWLGQAWPIDWLQNAWQTNWLDQAWRAEWIDQAWNKNWLQDAWYNAWLQTAWGTDWLQDAWQKAWLQDAWQNSWLNDAWGEQWLEKAWQTNWLDTAWQKNWLDTAWAVNWLEKAWSTDWLQKSWKEAWLEQAWQVNWLEKAWQQNWLEKAWYKTWINDNWKVEWLQKAWQKNWLDKAWYTDWLEKAWTNDWLNENWKQLWVKQTWKTAWVKETWTNEWVEKTFKKLFVNDVIKVLWGNRWWEFFNIFKDRFGGITTKYTKTGDSGKTSVDTSDIYKIYTAETGKAAAKALKDVKNEESSETGDSILSLAKQLTKNSVELRDPQVQTNALLAQILIVLEAIMQAENVAGGASLATTLAALGLGAIQPNTSNNAGTKKSPITL